MIVGAILGGYFVAHYVQQIKPSYVRGVVIAIGVGITVWVFVR